MKTAIVTGASGGIGSAIASKLAHQGYNTVIHYHSNKNKAQSLATKLQKEGCSVLIVQANLSKEEGAKHLITQTVQAFKGVDVLVNNAGISQIKLLTDCTQEDYYEIMDTNLKSAINLCRLVAPIFVSQQSGKIINVSSIWGEMGASCETLYSASKAGLVGFSLALAKELGPSNITVNVVSPGFIQTEMNASIPQDIINQIIDQTPLNRIGMPEDVANAVSFFASEQSSFITAQVLSVGGGWGK